MKNRKVFRVLKDAICAAVSVLKINSSSLSTPTYILYLSFLNLVCVCMDPREGGGGRTSFKI